MISLTDVLSFCQSHANKRIIFFSQGERNQFTFSEFEKQVKKCAETLREKGICKGMRVGICAANCIDWMILDFATIELGAQLVAFMEGALTQQSAQTLIEKEHLNVFFTDATTVEQLGLTDGNRSLSILGNYHQTQLANDEVAYGHDDEHSLVFSSGTGGQFKGLVISKRGVAQQMQALKAGFTLNSEDSIFIFMPFSSFQQRLFYYTAIYCGCEIQIVPPKDIVPALRQLEPSIFVAPPLFYQNIQKQLASAAAQRVCGLFGSRVRMLITGMAQIKGTTLDFFQQAGLPLVEVYGLTESGVVCINTPENQENGTVGLPLPGQQVHLQEDGEIVVTAKHPLVCKIIKSGDEVDESDTRIAGNQIFTGDLGQFSASGKLTIVGRKKTTIVSPDGKKVQPEPVEKDIEQALGLDNCVLFRSTALQGYDVVVYQDNVSEPKQLVAQTRKAFKKLHPELCLGDISIAGQPFSAENGMLTRNLKLNRYAIKAKYLASGQQDAEINSSMTFDSALARQLADIWCNLLGITQLTKDSSFLTLGGNSLLVMQLITEVETHFARRLAVDEVFEHHTFSALCHLIENTEQQETQCADSQTSVTQPLRLTAMQKTMWLSTEFLGEDYYNVPLAIELKGSVDITRMQLAFEQLCRHHEALRLRVEEKADEVVQFIADKSDKLEVFDISAFACPEQNAMLEQWEDKISRHQFDLSEMAPIKAMLVKVSEQYSKLFIVIHHMVSDGWSLALILQDLQAFYDEGNAITDITVPYTQWLFQQLKTEEKVDIQSQCDRLRGAPLESKLPSLTRKAKPNAAARQFEMSMPQQASDALTQLSEKWQLSSYTVLMGAFGLMHRRYASDDCIVVGGPVAHRHNRQLHSVVGCLMTIQAFPMRIVDGMTSDAFWRDVESVVFNGLSHSQVGVEKVIEQLAPAKNVGETPYYQSMLTLHNQPAAIFDLSGIQSQIQPLNSRAKVDITFNVFAQPKGLKLVIEFNESLYSEALVEHYANTFFDCLTELKSSDIISTRASDFNGPVSVPQSLSGEQKQHQFQSFFQMVEQQARQKPEAIAVKHGSHWLTYKTLIAVANRNAQSLHNSGVTSGDVVAIAFPNCIEYLVSVLAASQLGAVFLPIDVSLPESRRNFLVSDSGAICVITDEQQANEPWLSGKNVCYYSDEPLLSSELVESPALVPQDPAYIIYTSGSTGTPKGTLLNQGGLNNYLNWSCDQYLVGNGRGLAHLSVSFDASITTLLAPLAAGARVDIIAADNPIETLVNDIESSVIPTLIKLTPAHLKAGQVYLKGDVDSSMLTFVIGGEALYYDTLQQWTHNYPDARFINEYGPTEAVVGCCTYQVASAGEGAVPIGRPIYNSQLYINCSAGGDNNIGELVICGQGVALGYLNVTKVNGFRSFKGTNAYFSGDLVSLNEAGELVYHGRADDQVKRNGFRIELGEVEQHLLKLPDVDQAKAIVLELDNGANQLLGFVSNLACDDPLNWLRQDIPEYLIPDRIIPIDIWPLTSSGKIDSKSLLLHLSEQVAGETVQPEAAHNLLNTMIGLWQDVLKNKQLEANSNFFAAGGDSILAIQIVAKLKKQGVKLRPKQFFDHPTPSSLCEFITASSDTSAAQSGNDTELSVSTQTATAKALHPIQHWFFEQGLPSQSHWNQAQLFAVNGELDRVALGNAVAMLSAQHPVLHSRFSQLEGEWVSEVGGRTDAVLVSHEGGVSESQWEVVSSGYQAGLDISQGDNWRVVLLADEQGQTYVLILVHHLIIDGVSWRILLEDLWQCYEGARKGEQVSLTSTAPYSQWSGWLASQTAAFAHERDYWAGHEHGFTLNGQTNDSRNSYGAQAQVKATLDKVQTKVLLERLPMSQRAQINEVMVSALVDVLCQWQGTTQCSVMLEGHGRDSEFGGPDVSRSLGWFTSLYPQHFALQGADIGARLRHVRAQLKRVPQGGLGYGVLRYLGKDSQLQGTELAVSFNYLGQFDQALSGQTLLQPALLSSGLQRAAQGQRAHLLDINALVVGGELHITWHYSPAHLPGEQVKAQLAAYVARLQAYLELATQACMTTSGVDYPLLRLSDEAINRLGERYSWEGVSEAYPLSPLQEGLLFHERLSEGGQLYFNQLSGRLDGLSDVAKFKAAWQAVVKEQDILRSRFIWEGVGEPLQQVVRDVEVNWEEADWRGLNSEVQQAQLEAYLAADKTKGFALDAAPLMRFGLFRVGEARYELVWSRHHLLLDGWCTGLLLQDVLGRYEQGDAYQGPLRRPYKDYIAWLQKQDSGLDYWQETLAGVSGATALPVEATGAQGYGLVSEVLSQGQSEQLRAVAAGYGVTLNTLFQGAWARLLQQYSGDADVVFGVTVSGRPLGLAGAEQMVGLFINSLPLRVKQDAGELGSWLQQIQGSNLAMREYEHCSLAAIQQACGLGANETLFNSLMVFENYELDRNFAALSSQLNFELNLLHEGTHYPVTLMIIPDDGIEIQLCYQQSQLTPQIAEQLCRHLKALLADLACQSLEELSDWTIDEKAVLTAPDLPDADKTDNVVQRVLKAAKDTPEAIAVKAGQQQWSYRQLVNDSKAVAASLQSRGVEPGHFVGLYQEQGYDALVAVLATLMTGAAYVPISRDWPQNRISAVCAQLQLTAVIVDTAAHSFEQSTVAIAKLRTDCQSTFVDLPIAADAPAYVLFTSGSTGTPKGVVMPHSALSNMIAGQGVVSPQLGKPQCTLQFTSLCFDVSFQEIFTTWSQGAVLCLPESAWRQDLTRLCKFVAQVEVERIFMPYAVLSTFIKIAFEQRIALPSLKTVVTAGERLVITEELRQFFRLHQQVRLINQYGPTESHVVSALNLPECVDNWPDFPSIGSPLPGCTLSVVSEAHQPLTTGMMGELVIAGECLAHGYTIKELTKARFIDSQEGGIGRYYTSGDLVKIDSSGQIIFVGRNDEQIKTSGFRVELEEIERQLLNITGVSEAAVTVLGGSNKQLKAYIVTSYRQFDVQQVKSELAKTLPHYMVPGTIQLLEALPKLTSNKVDRMQLQTLSEMGDEVAQATAESEVEQVIASIWQEVLEVEVADVERTFYDYGGHSLQAAQIVSRTQLVFGRQLPLAEFLRLQTVAAVSRYLQQSVSGESLLYPVVKAVPAKYPLASSQASLWTAQQMTDERTGLLAFAFAIKGQLDIRLLQQAMQQVTQQHEMLRARVRLENGAEWQSNTDVAIDCESVSWPPEQWQSLAALIDEIAWAPIDLQQSPPVRMRLVEDANQQHALVITLHHLFCDGWSLRVLGRDLNQVYCQLAKGEKVTLDQGGYFYHYKLWLDEYLLSEQARQADAYWQEQLHRLPEPIRWQSEKQRNTSAGQLAVQIEESLKAKLEVLAAQHNVTPYMWLLTVFQLSVAQANNQWSIATGMPLANRNQHNENTIGLMINTGLVISNFSPAQAFEEMLQASREQVLSALNYQAHPFEAVLELHQSMQSSSAPRNLYNTWFVLQNTQALITVLGQAELAPIDLSMPVSRHDLSLSLQPITGDGWQGYFQFNNNNISVEKAQAMLALFHDNLAASMNNPKCSYAALMHNQINNKPNNTARSRLRRRRA